MKALSTLLLGLFVVAAAPGQEQPYRKFTKEFTRALEYGDESGMDEAVKDHVTQALRHYEATCWDAKQGKDVAALKEALESSWARVFGDAATLEKLDRWVRLTDAQKAARVNQAQNELVQCFNLYQQVKGSKSRDDWETLRDSLMQVAEKLSRYGHVPEAATTWGLLAEVTSKMPKRTIADRRDTIFALQRFLEVRDSWAYDDDTYYQANENLLKAERERLELAEAAAAKREEEGYSGEVGGVEGLVMPDTDVEAYGLEFRALDELDPDDCFVMGGPVPVFWQEVQINTQDSQLEKLGEDRLARQMNWFMRSELYMVRDGNDWFVAAGGIRDPDLQEVEVGSRPEISTFFLDRDRTVPYAMAFDLGGERETVIDTALNLSPSREFAPVFYRSAASWVTEIDEVEVTFYDDDADGRLFVKDPYQVERKVYHAGEPEQGTIVPSLDSIRIGRRGDRIPYSEFVKIADTWYHMEGVEAETKAGIRPLNPEYFKTGTLTLDWGGGRRTQPVILVVHNLTGPYRTAWFDLSGGDPVEVPIGEYEVAFGRIVSGQGSRAQMATILRGDSGTVMVEEGKETTLELGSGFRLDYARESAGAAEIAFKTPTIRVLDSAGCVYTGLQSCPVKPDVVFARNAESRRTRELESMVRMTDPDFINAAANQYANLGRMVVQFPIQQGAQEGDVTFRMRLPAPDLAVGLTMRKHPLFGALRPVLK